MWAYGYRVQGLGFRVLGFPGRWLWTLCHFSSVSAALEPLRSRKRLVSELRAHVLCGAIVRILCELVNYQNDMAEHSSKKDGERDLIMHQFNSKLEFTIARVSAMKKKLGYDLTGEEFEDLALAHNKKLVDKPYTPGSPVVPFAFFFLFWVPF